MSTMIELIPAFVMGMLVGALHLAGLWFTVQALARVSRPGLLIATSMILRVAIVTAGLYVIMDGHWDKLLAAAAGVTLLRFVVLHPIRVGTGSSSSVR